MTEEDAIALQTTVNEILALTVEKRSEIGGAMNWGDLLCLDVEVSLLDSIVTVTRSWRGADIAGIAVRTEW
jgi:hypothetical protein